MKQLNMKRWMEYVVISSIIFAIIAVSGCSDSDPTQPKESQSPQMEIMNIPHIAEDSATVQARVTDDGGAAVTERGICWSGGQTPTLEDSVSRKVLKKQEDTYWIQLSGLKEATTYYVRAYATNEAGKTGYSHTLRFKTKQASGSPPDQDTTNFHSNDLPTVDNSIPSTTISWDNTARKISHKVGYAEYGRVYRVNKDTLLLTYHCGPKENARAAAGVDIALRKSTDNGKTWSNARIIVDGPQPNYNGFQNPNILVLKNGWILLAFVGRGKPDDNSHDNVQICISKDRGDTWSDPKVVARGRSWEPGMVQLPDGTIDMFYSSEAAWWPPGDKQDKLQDILMVHSSDNGQTWTSPKEVSFSPGNRDGMAVPLALAGGKGIVFSIESIGNGQSPWIIWSSLEANFNYANYGTTQNGRRWPVTTPQNIQGHGPYLIQLPSGETVLSCHYRGGRNINFWKKSTMAVFVGNSMATHFTNVSYPWPNLPTNEGAYFNSLFSKNDTTIVAVMTRNFPDGHSEIWWKEGHLHY